MAKFGSLVYDKEKVDSSINKLQEAVNALKDTGTEIGDTLSILQTVRGFEHIPLGTVYDEKLMKNVSGIEFAPKYPELCVEYIQRLIKYIQESAHEIEDYENAGLGWKILATFGLAFSKFTEGVLTAGENIVDAGATLVGFTAGLAGNEEFQDKVASFIKTDHSGNLFKPVYENSPIGKYSIISYNSAGANVFKGIGIATGYIFAAAATGGGSIGAQVAVAGVGGLGAGTETGLQQGKSFNAAVWDGAKQAGVQMATAYAAGKIGKVVAARNPVDPTKVQKAQAGVKAAEANVKTAEANVNAVKLTGKASQIKKAESILKNANKNLDKATSNLSKVSTPRTIYNNKITDIGTNVNTKIANSKVGVGVSNVKNTVTSSSIYRNAVDGASKYIGKPIVNAAKKSYSKVVSTNVGGTVAQKASDVWKATKDFGNKAVSVAATNSHTAGNLVSSAVYTAPIVAFEESKTNYNMEHSLADEKKVEVKKDVPRYVLEVDSLPQRDDELIVDLESSTTLDSSSTSQIPSTSSTTTSSTNNNNGGWYQATRTTTASTPVTVASTASSNSVSEQPTTNQSVSNTLTNQNTNSNPTPTNTVNNTQTSSNITPSNSTLDSSKQTNQNNQNINNSPTETIINNRKDTSNIDNSTYTSNSGVSHSGSGRVNMGYSFDNNNNNNNNNGSTDSASQSQSVLSSVGDSVSQVLEDKGQLASSITGTQATRSQTIKIPTVSTPLDTSSKETNLVIPTAAALSAAAAAGIGTKAFMDMKNSSNNEEEYEEGKENNGFYSEEWNGTEDDMNVDYGTEDDADRTKVVLDDEDDYRYNANSVIEKYENMDDNIDDDLELQEQ